MGVDRQVTYVHACALGSTIDSCCIGAAPLLCLLSVWSMQWYKQGARFAKWRAVLRIAGEGSLEFC
jgi:hypothetical protein